MSAREGRQPPRFVPTLTDVVPEAGMPAPKVREQAASSTVPPAFVPTLHEVVAPGVPGTPSSSDAVPLPDAAAMAQALSMRVMARLEEGLEARLRDALAETVQRHSQALYQALLLEVEQMVGAAARDAVTQELARLRSDESSAQPRA